MRRALACFVLGLASFLPSTWAAEGAKVVVAPRADRDEAVYKCGETATFTINVTADGNPLTEGNVAAVLSLDGGRPSPRHARHTDGGQAAVGFGG